MALAWLTSFPWLVPWKKTCSKTKLLQRRCQSRFKAIFIQPWYLKPIGLKPLNEPGRSPKCCHKTSRTRLFQRRALQSHRPCVQKRRTDRVYFGMSNTKLHISDHRIIGLSVHYPQYNKMLHNVASRLLAIYCWASCNSAHLLPLTSCLTSLSWYSLATIKRCRIEAPVVTGIVAKIGWTKGKMRIEITKWWYHNYNIYWCVSITQHRGRVRLELIWDY